jgi:hypothetical protein
MNYPDQNHPQPDITRLGLATHRLKALATPLREALRSFEQSVAVILEHLEHVPEELAILHQGQHLEACKLANPPAVTHISSDDPLKSGKPESSNGEKINPATSTPAVVG